MHGFVCRSNAAVGKPSQARAQSGRFLHNVTAPLLQTVGSVALLSVPTRSLALLALLMLIFLLCSLQCPRVGICLSYRASKCQNMLELCAWWTWALSRQFFCASHLKTVLKHVLDSVDEHHPGSPFSCKFFSILLTAGAHSQTGKLRIAGLWTRAKMKLHARSTFLGGWLQCGGQNGKRNKKKVLKKTTHRCKF